MPRLRPSAPEGPRSRRPRSARGLGALAAAGLGLAAMTAPAGPTRAANLDSQPRERESFWAWDFRKAEDYALEARLRHASQQIWIYVEDGATVSDLAIARLARTFEDQVQPRLREALGREPYPGIDGREAITILLLDVRDDVYYRQAPHRYISGYFDAVNQIPRAALEPGDRRSNEREMIYLDVAPTDPEGDVLTQSAAHEYAHLIAWNHDPDEERWLDEAIGQLAVHVAGLPHPQEQLAAFLAAPEDALVSWTGSVADYGRAYAFGLYAYERFGGAGAGAARRLAQDPRNGLASLADLIAAPATVGTMLRDFGVAVRLDLPPHVDPRLGFRALEIGGTSPDALPAPAEHARGADALPTDDEVVVMAPWSVRFERYDVGGAPLAAWLRAEASVCYGVAWVVGDERAAEAPRLGCAIGGREERLALPPPPPTGSLVLVLANPSDRALALRRRASVLVEAQSTPARVFLPFGQAGSARGRAAR